jgi:hypothetical protein
LVTIAASRADEIAGGPWFTGYAERVDLYDDLCTVDDFDADARADLLGHPEYAVFGGGLDVAELLDGDSRDGVNENLPRQRILGGAPVFR